MKGSNIALLPQPKDGDGNDGGDPSPLQITIDTAENGFVVNVLSEEPIMKVYLFHDKQANGPEAMIQEIIDRLGITDKVKLQK